MKRLTMLETQVLQALLCGKDQGLSVLRQQAAKATVASREMTGVGFFTDFVVPADADRLMNRPTFKLGDVNGSADNVKHGIDFVLYVNDGVLSSLEGYTYDEPWPADIHGLVLSYSGGLDRDLGAVRRIMYKISFG